MIIKHFIIIYNQKLMDNKILFQLFNIHKINIFNVCTLDYSIFSWEIKKKIN